MPNELICAALWHGLEPAAARDGLWVGHRLLATTGCMAGSGSLAVHPRDAAGQATVSRPTRYGTRHHRQFFCSRHTAGKFRPEPDGPAQVRQQAPPYHRRRSSEQRYLRCNLGLACSISVYEITSSLRHFAKVGSVASTSSASSSVHP
jgi:hypothetical protein